MVLPISASQVAGIRGVSHWHLAQAFLIIPDLENFSEFKVVLYIFGYSSSKIKQFSLPRFIGIFRP
jgi:hypothetical protein